MKSGHVPFPSTEDAMDESLVMEPSTRSQSPEPALNVSAASSASPESHVTTSSSRLTSSDKLSALPSSPASPTPNASRIARPTTFATNNVKRGYRHSLDASTSLPAISAADFDFPMIPMSHSLLGTSRDTNVRLENHPGNLQRQFTPGHGSPGKETPRQRVSFDSDRNSLSTTRNVGQAFSRITTRGSDPPASPPALHSSAIQTTEKARSRPATTFHESRATSPLRILQNWSSAFHRGHTTSEERFVPVDPFKFKTRLAFCGLASHTSDIETGEEYASSAAYDCDDSIPVASIRSFLTHSRIFITDTLPRELYLNFLLRLPAMYFSRVARIFEDADVSRPDIQRMIDNAGGGGAVASEPNLMGHITPTHGPTQGVPPAGGGMLSPGAISGIGLSSQVGVAPAAAMMHMPLPFPDEWTPPLVSPALIRFKHSWEAFIDSLLREWKTLNLVSALLASAILTIFQIPQAADDPVTRTFALLSLICALMSLSYGCMYIVRFGTMKSMFHASRWAEEARKTNTSIWWNVWVLLATPAVWMAWAMLLFISAILSFVWRTGSVLDPQDRPPLGAHAVLGPRIGITAVLALGMVYLAMIVRTLKKYGAHQGSARALMPAGTGTRRGLRGWKPSEATERNRGKKERLRDIDAEMERRGRERERSTSTHVRRREEDPERRERRRQNSRDRDSKKGGLKGVLGLGFGSRIVARDGEQETDVEMDLKVPEVNVAEVSAAR
ncbi:hypothetical protein BDZ97DRAFT_2043648 [Flammula alnicola]|nr:hypothetical protein BDZ97DRAFT_2043648 [Flammula alnicola]